MIKSFQLFFSITTFKIILLSLLLFCASLTAKSNNVYNFKNLDSNATKHIDIDTDFVNQRDLREILTRLFHIKFKTDSVKFKGDGPYFSIVPVVGYTLQSGITGALVTSTSFYTSDNKEKFSNIIANAYFSQYDQYWTIVNSNIFLDKLKLNLFGDWRYYKFPTNTYGIGNHTTLSDILAIDYSYLRFYQLVFREIFNNVFIGGGYNLDYHWNIEEGATTGKVYNEMQKYQSGNSSVSSGMSINFQYDNRKNSINPQRGSFASIQYRPNFAFMGSDQNWQSLIINLKHYINFQPIANTVLAFWSYTDLTLKGNPPYLDMPSIGWDDYSNTGRGYVPGRFIGRNLLYFETEYRFPLTNNGLLGGVVFGNTETFFAKLTPNLNTIIPGYGLGLRIKLNKYSNTNVAIDYGFGIGGSKGLFFNLGEVF